ncbi:TniB family NTP-binding protein [Jannaschia sp. CCS1]|uniref:TniB family NTP-binding protein n=1 Tax=Jannaschia sp. (strain CCS1) TaxID=290400 RepID=UPI000053D189|nr:TniB family NTP-binding protein [Jannaschia sp. CCS1]ABD55923.1 TniB [Jannaschia sp. CCS1]
MPVPGTSRTSRPLEIVQIDHKKADIFAVDEETGKPIGRPWLILAMDVFSRMVTGFYLTMDAPSRLSTSLCLLHSVYGKTAWLKAREINEPWAVAGLPDRVHVDNSADFRSRAFKRGCENAGIAIDWRPPGTPRFGGQIERLIGTQMGRLHLLPGTTFSNAQDLAEYDSKKHAALTLRELERYIALDIVGSYHQSIHSFLSRPPLAVCRDREGEIPLWLPQDRLQFWVSFLPEQERTLRPTGIHLFGLHYCSAALSADVGRTKRRLLVKYDPRDMSRVFARRPSRRWVLYPRANQALKRPEALLEHPRGARMPSVAIYGDSGMGKTMGRFRDQHLPSLDSRTGIVNTPVLAMEMVSLPGERRFYGELLSLLGAPQAPRADIALMEQASLRIMKAIGVQVLVIDEVHNILAGTYREQRIVLNMLRFLSNRLQISLVCFGVNDAREAIGGDVQLARRFEQLTLNRWAANEDFETLVASILRNTPLQQPSVLTPESLRRIL